MALPADLQEEYDSFQTAKNLGIPLTAEGEERLKQLKRQMKLSGEMSHEGPDQGALARSRLDKMGIGRAGAFGVAAGRGALDTYQGVKQGALNLGEIAGYAEPGSAQAYTDEVNRDIGLYERDVAAGYPFEAAGGRILGNAASIPISPLHGLLAMGTTPGGAVVRGATEGIIEGLAQFDPTNTPQGKLRSGGTGLVFGAAGDYLPQLAARSIRGMRGGARAGARASQQVPPGGIPRLTNRIDPDTGMPLTRGQESGIVNEQRFEERIVAGMEGDEASAELQNFRNTQRMGLEERVTGVQDAVDARAIPGASPSARTASGVNVLRERANTLWDEVDAAFDAMREADLRISPELATDAVEKAKDALGVKAQIDPSALPQMLRDQGMPLAAEFAEAADNIVTRQVANMPGPPGDVLMSLEGLHAVRRAASNRAVNAKGAERTALRNAVSAIDQSLADMTHQGLLVGDVNAIEQLQKGIKLRAKYGHLYSPRRMRYRGGGARPDRAGRILQDIIENESISDDEVVAKLFGSVNPSNNPFGNTRTVEVIRRIREAEGANGPTFQAIKGAALERFKLAVMNTKDGMVSPDKYVSAWRNMNEQNETLLDLILTPTEHRELTKLNSYANKLIPNPMATNRSGTGYMNSANLTAALTTALGTMGALGSGDFGVPGASVSAAAAAYLGSLIRGTISKNLTRPVFEAAPGFGLPLLGAAAGQEVRREVEKETGVVK
jgi:hypothetical protein